jgi:hypothetical protein
MGTITQSSGAAAVTRELLRCGAAAGPLFISVFLVEGVRRADYAPRRHPVSALALGPRGWVQTANFATAGALTTVGSAGLLRVRGDGAGTRSGPLLIGAAGLGLLASAAFPTDPVNGYPPGTPDQVPSATVTGVLHNLVSVPVLVGLPVAALAYARQFQRGHAPRWAWYSTATAASAVINGALAGSGFGGGAQARRERAGLHQRAAVGALLSWTTALFLRGLRQLD